MTLTCRSTCLSSLKMKLAKLNCITSLKTTLHYTHYTNHEQRHHCCFETYLNLTKHWRLWNISGGWCWTSQEETQPLLSLCYRGRFQMSQTSALNIIIPKPQIQTGHLKSSSWLKLPFGCNIKSRHVLYQGTEWDTKDPSEPARGKKAKILTTERVSDNVSQPLTPRIWRDLWPPASEGLQDPAGLGGAPEDQGRSVLLIKPSRCD